MTPASVKWINPMWICKHFFPLLFIHVSFWCLCKFFRIINLEVIRFGTCTYCSRARDVGDIIRWYNQKYWVTTFRRRRRRAKYYYTRYHCMKCIKAVFISKDCVHELLTLYNWKWNNVRTRRSRWRAGNHRRLNLF